MWSLCSDNRFDNFPLASLFFTLKDVMTLACRCLTWPPTYPILLAGFSLCGWSCIHSVSSISESSRFSLDCLTYFRGHTLFHVGELLGETLSSNPWGQSTTRDFQLALAEDFCCVKRIRLPNWPGHVDSFTVWRRKNPQFVLCDGAHFQYVDTHLQIE